MEILFLEASIDTPQINMDPNTGCVEISGKSYPEDTMDFYSPVLDWFTIYMLQPNSTSKLVIKLEYFNSSSYKPILDLLLKMEELKNKNNQAFVEWHYKTNDPDMKETGEEFAEIVSIPFTYHTF